MIAAAIGNGTSRRGFDLNRLKSFCDITIGCNYLSKHKTFSPDYLVGVDTSMKLRLPMIKNRTWEWISRDHMDLTLDGDPIMKLIDLNKGWNNNSGIIATCYPAHVFGCRAVYMIGMDFFLPVPGDFNDIYGYNTIQSPSQGHVWNMIPANYPDTQFVRVGKIEDRDRHFFDTLKGFDFIESFEDIPGITA